MAVAVGGLRPYAEGLTAWLTGGTTGDQDLVLETGHDDLNGLCATALWNRQGDQRMVRYIISEYVKAEGMPQERMSYAELRDTYQTNIFETAERAAKLLF